MSSNSIDWHGTAIEYGTGGSRARSYYAGFRILALACASAWLIAVICRPKAARSAGPFLVASMLLIQRQRLLPFVRIYSGPRFQDSGLSCPLS